VHYAVQVRCSTNVACGTPADFVDVPVTCPSAGTLGKIGFNNKTTVAWSTTELYDAVRGDLFTLRSSSGNYNGTVTTCLGNSLTGSSLTDATTPGPGGGFYYLLRYANAVGCNHMPPNSYSTGHPKEVAGRDSEINADPDSCP
jgi:hypothetical protein